MARNTRETNMNRPHDFENSQKEFTHHQSPLFLYPDEGIEYGCE